MRCVTLALLACGATAFAPGPLAPRQARATLRAASQATAPEALRSNGFSDLADQLDAVRALRPTFQSRAVQNSLWEAAGLNPLFKVSGSRTGEPSFTRLFSHKTWTYYTGKSPIRRWVRTAATWRFSTVFRAVYPICMAAALWGFFVTSLPPGLLPRCSPVPMSLIGAALGLLLVFRVNNSYQRLGEARGLWGRAVYLTREVAQGVATALVFDETLPDRARARAAAAQISRYLLCYSWELNSKLTGRGLPDGAGTADLQPGEKVDVLKALLPAEEAEWLAMSRSRPLAALGALRRVLHGEFRAGNLPSHVARKLDEDVRELDLVVGGCERLFSSPVPPTMSRHIIRCLLLWLFSLPFVLAGGMAPATVAAWVLITSYIFVGIEEVGVQVEQPFELVPMTQLCNIIQSSVEEALIPPPAAKI